MLSTTDATKSAADLINVRRQSMANMPPELSPADLVKVFNGTLRAADAVPVATSSFAVSTPSATSGGGSNATPTGASGGGSSSGSGSTDAPQTDGKTGAAAGLFAPLGGVVVAVGMGVVSLLL
jgi:hypothetical protein